MGNLTLYTLIALGSFNLFLCKYDRPIYMLNYIWTLPLVKPGRLQPPRDGWRESPVPCYHDQSYGHGLTILPSTWITSFQLNVHLLFSAICFWRVRKCTPRPLCTNEVKQGIQHWTIWFGQVPIWEWVWFWKDQTFSFWHKYAGATIHVDLQWGGGGIRAAEVWTHWHSS